MNWVYPEWVLHVELPSRRPDRATWRSHVLVPLVPPTTSMSPYIAVCRFHMRYQGKPASDLDPDKVKRGYSALARLEHQLATSRFLVGDAVTLADVSLLAYTRVAHEGGFHLDGYAAVRRWIGEAEKSLGVPAAA
jgi:glutathione S-transferase